MEHSEGLRLDKLRCAAVHRELEADPAGSAPEWDALLVVEIPGPWPRDISAAEPFASLADEVTPTITGADGRRWRPQGVLPDHGGRGIHVMAFERDTEGCGPFSRREWDLPPDDPEALVALCAALLAADSAAISGFGDWRDDPPQGTVDLLLCTHGTRDVCCGGSGAALHAEVVAELGGSDTEAPEGGRNRVWRTSHAGGHRFAPTVVSLPEGISWSHLGVSDAIAVLGRSGDPADLGAHWRGSVTMESGPAQVADREAFVAHGWDWLAAERHPVLVSHDRATLTSTVDVLGHLGDGGDASVRVGVGIDRHIPMPSCGGAEAPEYKTEIAWRVIESHASRG